MGQFDLNPEKHRTDTELSNEYWKLKELKTQLRVQFYILKRSRPTKRTGICYLCLKIKLFTIKHQGRGIPDHRNELISKCRHKNNFTLMKHKALPLCKKVFVFGAFFWYEFLSCICTKYGELQSKSPYSLQMWINTGQTNPECNKFSSSGCQNIATLFWYHCSVILQLSVGWMMLKTRN